MSQYPATAGTAATAGAPATTTGFANTVEQNTVTTAQPTYAAPAPVYAAAPAKTHTSVKPLALLLLLAGAFIPIILYVAGLAALQSQCNRDYSLVGQNSLPQNTAWLDGNTGFSGQVLPCSKVYRWSWFIFAFECVVLLSILIATVMGRLWHFRLAGLALMAIATMLFMMQSEAFLTTTSITSYEGGVWKHRANVTAAGAIMMVVADVLIMLAMGIDRLVDHTGQSAGGYGHGHANKV